MAVRRDLRLTGQNPLAYLGVNAGSPPNVKEYNRAPTTDDYRNFFLGDMWIDASATPRNVYQLVSKENNQGIWQGMTFPTGGTNGQILIGQTGLQAVWGDLTSTGGTIAITGGAGTLNIESGGAVPIQFDGDVGSATPALGILDIVGGAGVNTSCAGSVVTINSTGGGISWTEVTGTSQAMAVDSGYILNNVAQVTATLPSVASVGSVVHVMGKGAGGWKIAQNTGQTIIWDEVDSTTTGVGGYLESTDDYDAVELICLTADTDFSVLSSKGNVTVV